VYSIVAEAILKFTVSCGSPFSCTNFSFVIFAKLSADNTCLGENGKKKTFKCKFGYYCFEDIPVELLL